MQVRVAGTRVSPRTAGLCASRVKLQCSCAGQDGLLVLPVVGVAMRKYVRFINGFRKFAQAKMQPEEAVNAARKCITERTAAREGNFLNLMEKGVFGYPQSPYLKLLQPKKIAFGDLRRWVQSDGLEAALRKLESEGVYFNVDEFKGRVPVKRHGSTFRCDPSMFDNPFLSFVYEVRSGGTRSAGTRVRIDFDYLHQRSLYDALLLDTHGCLTAPVANWFPVFPGAPGINSSLRFAHIGNPVRRWFSQVDEKKLDVGFERKLAKKLLHFLSKTYGCPLADAEYVTVNEAETVARWAYEMIQLHGACVVYTFAASAVRVCVAAAEADLDLHGVRFLVTGEPLTPSKKREIEAAGAVAVPVYGISEAGVIAAGCDAPYPESDHCHLYQDTTAIITHKCPVPHSDQVVDAFLFTSVLYESPKLLLNVGMGDFGNLSSDPCACGFGQVGFTTCLSSIRSYEKLTGEGVTFVGTDFVGIVEEKLPALFGGRSTDYQLVEEEDAAGIPRLRLLVSPRLGPVDERAVANTFLKLLLGAEDRGWAQAGTEMWRQSGTVQVVREIPLATAGGKILPFHLMKPLAPALRRPAGAVQPVSAMRKEKISDGISGPTTEAVAAK